MPKVSIIVPVYNSSSYLKDCLDSLFQQNLQDIEVIAIDDASTDQSSVILKQYQHHYKDKLKVITHEENKGLSISRNDGVKLATGEYIGFVDSDDFVHPEMYDDLYYAATIKNKPEIISTGIKNVNSATNYQTVAFQEKRKNGKVYHLPSNPNYFYWENPSCCNKIFRKDTIEQEPFLPKKIWEDGAFTYGQMIKADHIISFNNADYYYRQHEKTGIMASCQKINPNLLDIFDINDTIKNVAIATNRYDIYKEQLALIQSANCLQRIEEVARWNIPQTQKENIIQDIHNISTKTYGDWRDMNQLILTSKVNEEVLENYHLYDINIDKTKEESKEDLKAQLLVLTKSKK